jgi:alpha-D-ribose 1-methylphosphonate 5-triphosphate synthase subunit PhnL
MQAQGARTDPPLLDVSGVSKTFTMHLRGGTRIPVMTNVSFHVHAGECLALVGPSGVGKSSLLRIIYGNYRCDAGSVKLRDADRVVDFAVAAPRDVLAARRRTIGYVSQFLRVIPRVPTLAVVAAAGRETGIDATLCEATARKLLTRLNIHERLWDLPPATFSGGEQQRVNIARGLIGGHALLLLDEPTASLDPVNRDVVIELVNEAKARGVAILGIFHDQGARDRIADRHLDLSRFAAAA